MRKPQTETEIFNVASELVRREVEGGATLLIEHILRHGSGELAEEFDLTELDFRDHPRSTCRHCGEAIRLFDGEWLDEEQEADCGEWLDEEQEADCGTGSGEHEPQPHADTSEDEAEVYEWWAVSSWLARRLRELDEVVLTNSYGNWWARTTTGQAIALDPAFQTLAKDLAWVAPAWHADAVYLVEKIAGVLSTKDVGADELGAVCNILVDAGLLPAQEE